MPTLSTDQLPSDMPKHMGVIIIGSIHNTASDVCQILLKHNIERFYVESYGEKMVFIGCGSNDFLPDEKLLFPVEKIQELANEGEVGLIINRISQELSPALFPTLSPIVVDQEHQTYDTKDRNVGKPQAEKGSFPKRSRQKII